MSLRDELLARLRGGVIEEPKRDESAAMPSEPESEPSGHPPGACQKCGSTLFSYPGGAGKRCQTCGLQTGVVHSNGVPRSQLESFSGGRAQFNTRGFCVALTRLFAGSRR
jgi:hypothetical protein